MPSVFGGRMLTRWVAGLVRFLHEAKMNRLAYLEAKETGDWGYFERKRDRERREIAKEVEIETLGYDPDYHFDVDDFDDIV